VISDFEEGTAVVQSPPTPAGRLGSWYTFADTVTATAPTNTVVASGSTNTCNRFALSAQATGHTMFAGFGATLSADPANPGNAAAKGTVSVAGYDGISFNIKSNSGTQPPLWMEILNTETQPTVNSGTGNTMNVNQYNTRGQLLTNIGTTATTVYVPFGALIPRFLPSATATTGCPAAGAGVPPCQAPNFNPASVLGFQFSLYPDFQTNMVSPGAYNVTVDDVVLYKRPTTGAAPDLPAPPNGGGSHPFPRNLAVGQCAKPTGADGKFLVGAYNAWKSRFVTPVTGSPQRVQRPENNNDTVSESIAYGMLIAVYMNDKALFDGLLAYWKVHLEPNRGSLMTWCVPNGGNSCTPVGGTATDADGDAAFALLMASRQWTGGTYATDATNIMHDMLTSDMVGTTYIKGGSNYANNGITNPSYFAPAYYRVFGSPGVDTANSATWNALANTAYTLLGNINNTSPTNGLYPAWCSFNGATPCAQAAVNGTPATDTMYQYDSHRIPWRIGLDYCWNGTAAAQQYVAKTSGFFSGIAANGVGRIVGVYSTGGAPQTTDYNSMSAIGTAAVGAMSSATYAAFVNEAYQAVLDMSNRNTLDARPGMQAGYSYYNATVGLITLLTMTGNFTVF
jgi:endo-1,4-beta-D-glucanase Y